MAVFGWVVLLALTLFVWFSTWAISSAELKFSGKFRESWLPLILAIGLSALTCYTVPFTIVIN